MSGTHEIPRPIIIVRALSLQYLPHMRCGALEDGAAAHC